MYFIPHDEDFIGVFDYETNKFYGYPIRVVGPGKYSGGVIVGNYLYMAPYNADHIGVFNLESKEFTMVTTKDNKISVDLLKAGTYSNIKVKQVGDNIDELYLVPYNANYFATYKISTQTMSVLDENAIDETGDMPGKFSDMVYSKLLGIVVFVPYNYTTIVTTCVDYLL